jgi:hypothetical protein
MLYINPKILLSIIVASHCYNYCTYGSTCPGNYGYSSYLVYANCVELFQENVTHKGCVFYNPDLKRRKIGLGVKPAKNK